MKITASKIKNILSGLLILLVVSNGFTQYSVTTNKKNHSVTITKNGLTSFKVEHKGTIDISDDDKDVTAISSGGYLEISKAVFGNKRTIRIENEGGKLKKDYYVGRQSVEFEPEGRQWLAEILPEVVRSSSIGARSRVNRFYKKGGVQAVMEELSIIDSDYVESIYASILLEKKELSSADLVEAVQGISSEIDSDYYLSNVLKDNTKQLLKNDDTSTAFFKAVAEVDSDYYASNILKEALESGDFSAKQTEAIVEAAKSIGSDHYMASVFTEVMDNDDVSDEVIVIILSATDDIESDHYQTEVLKEVVNRNHISAEIHRAILESVGNISSDHYMSEVFREMLDNEIDEKELEEMVEVLKSDMSSDHYTTEVVRELVDVQKLNDQIVLQLSELIEEMSSSHYATEILREVANEGLTEKQIIILLDATSSISSDHYLTEVLLEFADGVKEGSPALKDAYRKAAKSISSDTYYGKAIKAID